MTQMWRSTAFAASIMFIGVLSACGGGGTGPAPEVSVSVSPAAATINSAGTQALTATVTNASNGAVTWTASGGTISGAGTTVTYQAPDQGGSYQVTATSVEDTSKSATATITVTPVSIAISPAGTELFREQPAEFTATVSGSAGAMTVTWAATCGETDPDGNTLSYVAPDEVISCDITATSVLDPSKSTTVQASVRGANAVTAAGDVDDGACTWDHCSLREAVNAANAQANADTIYLSADAAASPSARGPATAPSGPAGIALGSGLPVILSDLVIVGSGSDVSDIDMGGNGRAFDVAGAVLSLFGLTVRNGAVNGHGGCIAVHDGGRLNGMDLGIRDCSAMNGEGGGLLVLGEGTHAELEDAVIDGNMTITAGWPGGGVSVVAGASLSMNGGRISNNQAAAWGGGMRAFDFGSIILTGTLLQNNTAGVCCGGGFMVENPQAVASPAASSGPARQVPATGYLLLDGVTVSGNTTVGTGGGVDIRSGVQATIRTSSITGNDAVVGGAGVSAGGTAVVTIEDSSIDENVAAGAGNPLGGGLYVWGEADVTMVGGSLDGNVASVGGGFLFQQQASGDFSDVSIRGNDAPAGGGGAFMQDESDVVLSQVDLSENTSTSGSGGITLFGTIPAAVSSPGDESGALIPPAGINVNPGLTLVMSESTVSGNSTNADSGGGITLLGTNAMAEINGTVVSGNSSGGVGGGLLTNFGATATVTDSDFIENTAATAGGGFWTRGPTVLDGLLVSGNTAGTNGGGLAAGSNTTVRNSTFVDNVAGASGGGVFTTQTAGTPPSITNSTFSGNMALNGGGLLTILNATVLHSTFVGNSATNIGGGFLQTNAAGTLLVTNTLVSGNTSVNGDENCAVSTTFGGSVSSGGGNVSDDASCNAYLAQASDLNEADAGVNGALADNGGRTGTHALQEGSVAIGNAVASAVTTDQRGAPRDDEPDSGAFEFGATVPAAVAP